MAVTLIHCFDVPTGREDEFLEAWQALAAELVGCLGSRLYRRSAEDVGIFAFIGVEEWESKDEWRAATEREQYRAKLPAMRDFIGYRGLYELIQEEAAGA
ncbi:antibiotic biosynthesis monooxygenase family protein [Saccharopolyspora taberi]|uniref:ABM domain-containing protein n=1 Tax=Saccharopolyspora taberi TaxID=60895 RepID=A0ABN3VK37_9PSEU